MSNQTRHPAGVPVGGQFAASSRPSAGLALGARRERGEQEQVDIARMDQIALCLGSDEEWDGSADYLDEIAEEIASSGRPHPGAYERAEDYRGAWNAYKTGRDDAAFAHADAAVLDRLALHLGRSEDWSSDDLEVIADSVRASGRPSPGDSVHGAAYRRALRAAALEKGRRDRDGLDDLEQIAAEHHHPAAIAVVHALTDSGANPADFDGLGQDYLYDIEESMSPVCDAVVGYVQDFEAESQPGEEFAIEDHVEKEWAQHLEGRDQEPVQTVIDLLEMATDRGEVTNGQIEALSFGDLQLLADNYAGPLVDGANPASAGFELVR